MADLGIPDNVRRLADERRDARARRDFPAADRLKAQIEAAGWSVVDKGDRYRLYPAHPADVVDGGRVRYGWSGAVPSRFDADPVGVVSVVVVAPDDPDTLEGLLAALAASIDDGIHRVVVANAPPAEVETLLARLEAHWAAESATAAEAAEVRAPPPADRAARAEVVWLASPMGAAAALNAGIRRAEAAIVVVLDPSVEVAGDFATPLASALADPAVAVAGPWGLVSADLRRFEPAAPGMVDVTAIDGAAMAFRRSDYAERGPLDEHFASDALLDAWWSLVLRDQGEEGAPRRAVVADVPVVRREAGAVDAEAARDRAERRNRYRIIDRFGSRRDLTSL